MLSVWPVGPFCCIDQKTPIPNHKNGVAILAVETTGPKWRILVQQVVLILILWCFAFIGYQTKVGVLSCVLEFGVCGCM